MTTDSPKTKSTKKRQKESHRIWRFGTNVLQLKWRQRRHRHLMVTEKSDKAGQRKEGRRERKEQRQGLTQKRRSRMSWSVWCVIISILAGLPFCLELTDLERMANQFVESYTNQLQSIVHNRVDYCDRSGRLGEMVAHARSEVLHQEKALDDLERALDNVTYNAIAIVGSSGVGKSQTASIMHERFPWPGNVQTLSWGATSSTDKRMERVESMLKNLAHCGRNLILIDNMTPADGDHVNTINEMIKNTHEIANASGQPKLKQLTIVYIFSLNRLLPDKAYDAQKEGLLTALKHTHVINYQMLEPDHLLDCIYREALLTGTNLTVAQIEEIIQAGDARNAGCKSVCAKVALYSKPQNQLKD